MKNDDDDNYTFFDLPIRPQTMRELADELEWQLEFEAEEDVPQQIDLIQDEVEGKIEKMEDDNELLQNFLEQKNSVLEDPNNLYISVLKKNHQDKVKRQITDIEEKIKTLREFQDDLNTIANDFQM